MAAPRLILALIAHALLLQAEASSQLRAHASNQSAGVSVALQPTSPLSNTLGQAAQPQDPTPPCIDAVPFTVPCDTYNVSGFLFLIFANIFPAKTTDIFPSIFGIPTVLSLSPDFAFYKLKVCPRDKVLDCMPYSAFPLLETCTGRGDKVLPSRLRGIYWFDGLFDPSNAVSTGAADFDAQTRVLSGPLTDDRWSWTADNSTWQGFYWSLSGPSIFNSALFPHFSYRVYFNEDYTFGQIMVTLRVVYVTVEIPVSILDWRMYWQGNDSWRRKSYFLIWDLPGSDYYLRRIINGDGFKGAWYDKGWLTYKDGLPVAVGQPISPK